jgi:hypothetical protein
MKYKEAELTSYKPSGLDQSATREKLTVILRFEVEREIPALIDSC